MGWSQRFEDPIELPKGVAIVTLEGCRCLPKKVQAEPHWQLAAEQVLDAAEGRNFLMHARIAMLRALNHGKPAPERGRRRAKAYTIISGER
jgi:hypothetical protein